jgi:hypothetical protein
MVRFMTLRHVFVSLSVACLAACSSGDTIVSLNVTATDRVPVVERIQVTFKQGSHSYVHDFAPPKETSGDDVESIKNGFYQRITLPGDWDEATAKISIEAFQDGGGSFTPALTDETTVTLEPEGVVAAYVELDIPEPPPVGGAGGEGAGGAPGEGGTSPAGGVANDAGGMPSGAAGEASNAGAGEASNAGASGAG